MAAPAPLRGRGAGRAGAARTAGAVATRSLPSGVAALWGDYLFFGIRALTTAGLLALAVAVVLGLRRGPAPARD
ncbi:hypothetical protein ACQP1P_11605 [Dactylosporangium sp. CA-052675]|uniref:hypothetical protein n=1 Tax=Dactylosporangium sp. CA-052675 TaxID=3239927 RepID=UPI003D91364C